MVAKGAWIKVDTTADALALLAGVNPKQVTYALNAAHKTLARTINKTIKKEVRDKYAIKAGDFKRPTLSHEETVAALSLRYKGARLSLSRFNPVQRGVQVGRSLQQKHRRIGTAGASRKGATGIWERRQRSRGTSGVYAKIRKDKGMELVTAEGKFGATSKGGAKGFIARGRRGKNGPISNEITHVWAREGKKRLPIQKLTGPAQPQLIANKSVMGRASAVIREKYDKTLHHELEFRLSREFNKMFGAKAKVTK